MHCNFCLVLCFVFYLPFKDGSTAMSIAMEAGHRDIGVLLYAHSNCRPGSPSVCDCFVCFDVNGSGTDLVVFLLTKENH
jgi:hypothetical protein